MGGGEGGGEGVWSKMEKQKKREKIKEEQITLCGGNLKCVGHYLDTDKTDDCRHSGHSGMAPTASAMAGMGRPPNDFLLAVQPDSGRIVTTPQRSNEGWKQRVPIKSPLSLKSRLN